VSRRLLRWTRRGEEARRAAQAFEGQDAARLAVSEVHNEMAVLDPATKEIRNGVDGLLWWLEGSRLAWLARLLGWGPLRWAVGVGYPVIAYNRRILAPPPPRAIACACDPDPRPGATIALGAFALAVVVGAFVGVGALLRTVGPQDEPLRTVWLVTGGEDLRAWVMLSAVWVLPTLILVSLLRPVGTRLLHATAFLWSTALGAPLLVAGAALHAALGGAPARWPTTLSVIVFTPVFTSAYGRRLSMLRASSRWWVAVGLPWILLGVIPGLARRLLSW